MYLLHFIKKYDYSRFVKFSFEKVVREYLFTKGSSYFPVNLYWGSSYLGEYNFTAAPAL